MNLEVTDATDELVTLPLGREVRIDSKECEDIERQSRQRLLSGTSIDEDEVWRSGVKVLYDDAPQVGLYLVDLGVRQTTLIPWTTGAGAHDGWQQLVAPVPGWVNMRVCIESEKYGLDKSYGIVSILS